MQLHDLQRIAHILGLIIHHHINSLHITTAGTPKNTKTWDVQTIDEAMQVLQKIRRENHPL